MNNSIIAKIFGWAQFGLQTAAQIGSNAGHVHGVWGWLSLIASLATAVAVHGASKTNGTN